MFRVHKMGSEIVEGFSVFLFFCLCREDQRSDLFLSVEMFGVIVPAEPYVMVLFQYCNLKIFNFIAFFGLVVYHASSFPFLLLGFSN